MFMPGDKVQISSDKDAITASRWANTRMLRFAGNICTVKIADYNDGVCVKENSYIWDPDILTLVDNPHNVYWCRVLANVNEVLERFTELPDGMLANKTIYEKLKEVQTLIEREVTS